MGDVREPLGLVGFACRDSPCAAVLRSTPSIMGNAPKNREEFRLKCEAVGFPPEWKAPHNPNEWVALPLCCPGHFNAIPQLRHGYIFLVIMIIPQNIETEP